MNWITIADVSEWSAWKLAGSPAIDWATVNASGKVAGAIIRLGSGIQYVDHNVSDQHTVEAARKAGIPIGFYLYAVPSGNPVTSANQHAGAFTQIINAHGGIQGSDLCAVLDLETTGGLTDPQLVAFCRQWLKAMMAAIPSPRPPLVVYSNLDFFQTHLGGMGSDVLRWVADYGVRPPKPWIGWQYADKSTVPGIPGPCDLSHFEAGSLGLEISGPATSATTSTPPSAGAGTSAADLTHRVTTLEGQLKILTKSMAAMRAGLRQASQ